MHKGHLAGCAVGVVLALGFVSLTGGSAGSLGVLLAAVICPVAMIVAMKLLMGEQHREPDGTVVSRSASLASERPAGSR